MEKVQVIFIVDDDKSVRSALSLFLTAAGYQVESFGSSEEFLEREPFYGSGCLVLDVNLEGRSGLELHKELISKGYPLPVIFITGAGNISMGVQAVKRGAVNFLEKPFKEEELIQAVSEALEISLKQNEWRSETENAGVLVGSLTPRENEILTYLITGMLNKQIAAELHIAEHTVKLHRQSISEKLGVKSVPEILRIADKAGIIPYSGQTFPRPPEMDPEKSPR